MWYLYVDCVLADPDMDSSKVMYASFIPFHTMDEVYSIRLRCNYVASKFKCYQFTFNTFSDLCGCYEFYEKRNLDPDIFGSFILEDFHFSYWLDELSEKRAPNHNASKDV